MDRRTFLEAGLGVATATSLAGCAGQLTSRSPRAPAIVENRPNGIYLPGHVEGMQMVGTTEQGDYGFGLMYSYAHRFWNVNGETTSLTEIGPDDDIHLMASVWDAETQTILPETGLSVEIYRESELVSQEAIYPMLSQPMGFHYGANFGLDGDGTYDVRISVGGLSTRRTDSFQDRFERPATARIPFGYSESKRDEISFRRLEDAGSPGAVDPVAMEMLPSSIAPHADALPGRVVGTGGTDGAVFVTTVLDSPPAGVVGQGQYLAVSARSQYNRMVLPAMSLSAAQTRDGEILSNQRLTRTLDPSLGYHYGAVVDAVQSGDQLTLSPTLQPQTARHEGYETAFGGETGAMEDIEFTVNDQQSG